MLKCWVFFFTALPFLWIPSLLEAHSLRKSVFLILVGAHLIFRAWRKIKPIEFQPRGLDYLLIFYVLIRILSSGFLPPDPQVLMFSLETLMWESSLLLFYLLIRSENPGMSWWSRVVFGLLVSFFLCAILQITGAPFVREMVDGRLQCSLFHPNVLGILVVSLCAFLSAKGSRSPSILAGLLVAFLLVMGSGSRNAFFWLLVTLMYFQPVRRVFILVPLILIPGWEVMRISTFPAEAYRSRLVEHFTIRLEVYKSTWHAILSSPSGTGAGLYSAKIHPHTTEKLHGFFPNPLRQSLQKAHNVVLESIVESGWVLWIWWFCALTLFWKLRFSCSKAAVWILFLGAMFSVVLNYPEGQIFLVLFLSGAVNGEDGIIDSRN